MGLDRAESAVEASRLPSYDPELRDAWLQYRLGGGYANLYRRCSAPFTRLYQSDSRFLYAVFSFADDPEEKSITVVSGSSGMLTSRQVRERWQDDLPVLLELAEEMVYVNAYLYIVSQRFGKRLSVDVDLPHELMDCMVPRLILQPVIENAVEHGIGPGGQGHIALRGCRRDGFLILEIENDGGLTPEDATHIRRLLSPDHDMAGEPSGSIGIANVNQRLRILYGPDCGLSIFSGEGSLVTARLTIALPKVLTDFETGAEPDVLFFFTDADAEPFIEAGKVVDIASIRAEYPDYAANMRDSMMAVAADGKSYAVPSSGFWENMFVNTKVLVDDESIIVEGLRQVLDWEAYHCQVCATASGT